MYIIIAVFQASYHLPSSTHSRLCPRLPWAPQLDSLPFPAPIISLRDSAICGDTPADTPLQSRVLQRLCLPMIFSFSALAVLCYGLAQHYIIPQNEASPGNLNIKPRNPILWSQVVPLACHHFCLGNWQSLFAQSLTTSCLLFLSSLELAPVIAVLLWDPISQFFWSCQFSTLVNPTFPFICACPQATKHSQRKSHLCLYRLECIVAFCLSEQWALFFAPCSSVVSSEWMSTLTAHWNHLGCSKTQQWLGSTPKDSDVIVLEYT